MNIEEVLVLTARLSKRLVLVSALVVAVAAGTAGAAGTAFPKRIALPNGFQPEGIATDGEQFFVGSIPTGAVYRGSVRSGKGAVLVRPRAGRSAIGVEADRGRLFVAGGQTGKAYVYDARTGRPLASYALATAGSTFVNDVAVSKTAAYFTDSFQPVLYRVPLGAGGRPGAASAVTRIPLAGDIAYQAGFNANGIDVTADGKALLIVQSNTGKVFAVDPATGAATTVDLAGETVPNGDGLLLVGRRLHVVQNQQSTVTTIALAADLRSGQIVRRLTDPLLDVPTTVDRVGSRLYAVNARFGASATPSTPYWVTRLPA